MIIVVSILAILAVIAVPNFLEAQTRSRVSRAKSDMRTLALGLESFLADHKRYPEFSKAVCVTPKIKQCITYSVISNDLTTPIAYLNNLDAIYDVFAEDNSEAVNLTEHPISKQYGYDNGTEYDPITVDLIGGWLLSSRGPDLTFHSGSKTEPSYDPTNGSISRGDIHRSQKDPDFKIFDVIRRYPN